MYTDIYSSAFNNCITSVKIKVLPYPEDYTK